MTDICICPAIPTDAQTGTPTAVSAPTTHRPYRTAIRPPVTGRAASAAWVARVRRRIARHPGPTETPSRRALAEIDVVDPRR